MNWTNFPDAIRNSIESHHQVAPVRIGALARELGLEVKTAVLEPNISGEIRPSTSAPANFRILVNRHEHKERQRFTIAHEIAHFLLHSHLIGDGLRDTVLYRSRLSDAIEREANALAADLLMPDILIRNELKSVGESVDDQIASDIAEKFEVSLPAMKIRLGM